jgi:hypothetical protein
MLQRHFQNIFSQFILVLALEPFLLVIIRHKGYPKLLFQTRMFMVLQNVCGQLNRMDFIV